MSYDPWGAIIGTGAGIVTGAMEYANRPRMGANWNDSYTNNPNQPQDRSFDPNAFKYGPNGALAEAMTSQTRGQQINAREAITPDYTQAIGYMQQAGQVGGATDMYRNAALGTGYSAGQAQLAQGLAAQQANAQSIARSAGGGAYGQASAAGQVAMMDPAMRERGAQMAEMLRAQEMQQGMQGYANAAGDMRQRGMGQADFAGQMANNTARMQMGQTQRNDAGQMAWEKMAGYQRGEGQKLAIDQQKFMADDTRYLSGLRQNAAVYNDQTNRRTLGNLQRQGSAAAGGIAQSLGSGEDD